MSGATAAKSLPVRRDVAIGDTWDLSSLFRSDAEWDSALAAWEGRIAAFAAFAGTLGSSPERLAECLAFDLDHDREGDRIGGIAMISGRMKLAFSPESVAT